MESLHMISQTPLLLYFLYVRRLLTPTPLRRGSHRRLHVVAAQELLQVQDGQHVALIQGQQLAQRGIRLDGLLVHQVVVARILHHTLGHRRPAHLRVLGLAQERAQLSRDLHGLGEDAGLGLGTLHDLRLALAAAIRLLRQARRLLLNGLQRRRRSRRSRLQARQLLLQVRDGLLQRGTHVLIGRHLRRGDNGLGSSHRLNHLLLLNLGLGRLRRLGRLGGNHLGNSSNGNGNGNGLSNSLRSLLGRLHGGAHFGGVGGSI